MADLKKVDKAMSTYNPKNYNYHPSGSYICADAKDMIWAQCDGAICEVVDENNEPKPAHQWQFRDKSICTCQAVQSPALMPGRVQSVKNPDGQITGYTCDQGFLQKFCGSKPPLDSIQYPEDGIHISVPVYSDPSVLSSSLLETPIYRELIGFYEPLVFEVSRDGEHGGFSCEPYKGPSGQASTSRP